MILKYPEVVVKNKKDYQRVAKRLPNLPKRYINCNNNVVFLQQTNKKLENKHKIEVEKVNNYYIIIERIGEIAMPKPKIGKENELLVRVFVRFTEEDMKKINKFMSYRTNIKFYDSISGLIRYTVELCRHNNCILSEEYIPLTYNKLEKKELKMPESLYNYILEWSKVNTKGNLSSALRHLTLSYINSNNSKKGKIDIKDW